MKRFSLILIIMFTMCSGYFYSQNKSVQTNTVPASKSKIDVSKYVGRYNLLKLGPNDSCIVYDYFDLYEKNGKLQCTRYTKDYYFKASVTKKNLANKYECEIIKIDEENQKIIIKFFDREYTYKFLKNKIGNYEIIIVNNALVYEKK